MDDYDFSYSPDLDYTLDQMYLTPETDYSQYSGYDPYAWTGNFGETQSVPNSYFSDIPSEELPSGPMSYPQETSWWDSLRSGAGSALDYLGTREGQGLLSLGLGGLSLYGNYLAGQQNQRSAANQLNLLKQRDRLSSADEFAKMHALSQIIQARQGINLDPSLAYAQAMRQEMGMSPRNATEFAGVDVGGPMKVGLSSQDRLNAMNRALGNVSYTMAMGGYATGGDDYAMGGYPHGGLSYIDGDSGGQEDNHNAHLSHGEYVFDADVVAALGDGNSKAGARKLDQMRENIRQHKRSAPKKSIPPKAKDPMKYLRK